MSSINKLNDENFFSPSIINKQSNEITLVAHASLKIFLFDKLYSQKVYNK